MKTDFLGHNSVGKNVEIVRPMSIFHMNKTSSGEEQLYDINGSGVAECSIGEELLMFVQYLILRSSQCHR